MIAPPVIEQVGSLLVVRDDLIDGGTKRRALPALIAPGHTYVYGSSVEGYAQVAVSYACRALGARAVIVTAGRQAMHPNTRLCQQIGARIVAVRPGYLTVIQKRARDEAERIGGTLLPFGLDTEPFLNAMATVGCEVAKRAGPPAEVWTVAGSGVLSRSLQRAFDGVPFHAVQIGHALTQQDVGRARIWVAPESFSQAAKDPPPFPSNPNYDSKAWQFIARHAVPGALFWNVA